MKYKKLIKNIKKKFLTGCAIALTALFASVPAVDAFAADTVSSESSELEALRIKKEAAQAAYDAALADKLMAEDEVENARIALKDAQDNYEDVRERYATGFTGFLQWVIETEDDPVKAEDARRVLEEAFAGEQQISADDPANITRMLYMADWLEELAEYFRSNYGVESDASHAAMRLAQAGFGEYSGEQAYYDALFENADDKEAFEFPDQEVLMEKAYDEVAFENERIPATKNKGIFKGFWCIHTDLASAQQEGMPLLEGLSKQVQDRPYFSYGYKKIRGYDRGDGFLYVIEDGEEMYTGLPIQTDPQMETLPIITVPYVDYAEPCIIGVKDVNEDYMAEILKTGNTFFKGDVGAGGETNDYSLIFENHLLSVINYSKGITIGNALGVGSTGENESLGVVFNGKGTYTIAEYASALREYYSMTDPLAAKAYLSSKNDDLDNARRQLAGAEGLLATAYGTLKGAEKEYEEAVAGLAGRSEVPVNAATASEAEELIGKEAAGYADVVSEL